MHQKGLIYMGEKLKWLMHALNVSGVELANHLGIDYAIVSKWRTGKRGLRYRSEHTRRLAAYMLSSAAEKDGHIIRDMLKELYPELDVDDPQQLENTLCLWLTVPEKPSDTGPEEKEDRAGVFSVKVDTTLGIKNMFRSQWRFFQLLEKMEPGQTVTVADFGAVSWSGVDLSYVEETVAETLKSVSFGHKIKIIDQITKTYRPWDFMFRFIPVYLNENVTSYYYTDPHPFPLRQNIFSIEGKAALTVSSISADPELVISSFYQQPEYLQFYDALTETIMENSHLMIQTMQDRQIHELLDIIDSHMKSSRLLYMINKLPTFRNMTPALLREILTFNNVKDSEQQLCLSANQKSTAVRGRCQSRQIYDLDAFEAMAGQTEIIEHDLSAILGRTIKMTRQQFLRQLEHIKNNVRADNYTLVLYPFSKLRMETPPPINIIVQDDSLSAAWDVEKYTRRMYSEELSIVNGFYQYADSVWEHIPSVSKTEEWCKKQIDRILTYEI